MPTTMTWASSTMSQCYHSPQTNAHTHTYRACILIGKVHTFAYFASAHLGMVHHHTHIVRWTDNLGTHTTPDVTASMQAPVAEVAALR